MYRRGDYKIYYHDPAYSYSATQTIAGWYGSDAYVGFGPYDCPGDVQKAIDEFERERTKRRV